ncbi:MAG: outer membrane protein transport protein [Deltaproteobacteria bacterium]|nr:outer membrane protein transport protein [Deltaproteobacteria bacterium]
MRRSPAGLLILLLSLSALAVAPASADASALDLFGYGGRSPALAGTGISFTDSFDALYTNPAGLSEARQKRMSVGFMASDFDLHYALKDRDVDPVMGVIVGGDVPIPFGGALKDRITIGIGLHVPPLLLSRAVAPLPGEPFLALLEHRGQVVAFMVGAGARITRHISVGIASLSLAALGGFIDVSADPTKRFTSTAEQQLLVDYAPIAGVRWRPSKKLSAGLVYRGQSAAKFDILVTNMIGDALPVTLPAIRVRGYSQYDPRMVEAEASYQVLPRLAVTGALAWKQWSSFPPPTEDPVIDAPPRVRPGFSDTFVPKLAARFTLNPKVELRGGYRLEMTPAPEQTGRENLLDNTRHIVTAGAGFKFAPNGVPIRIDAYVQAHFLAPRTSTKDQTLAPEDRDPTYLSVSSSGKILVGGLTFGVDL